MRQITKDSVDAFFGFYDFSRDNTRVVVEEAEHSRQPIAKMYLHGNLIAVNQGGKVCINHGGWMTLTTKERLNGITSRKGIKIYQKAGEWFLLHPVAPKEYRDTPWEQLAGWGGWVEV